jgi:hypothetical protein
MRLLNSSYAFIFLLLFFLFYNSDVIAYFEKGPAVETNTTQQPAQANPPQVQKKTPEELYNESITWFPKETPPLIREFLLNPDNDELAKQVARYLKHVQTQSVKAEEKIVSINAPAEERGTGSGEILPQADKGTVGISPGKQFTDSDILQRLALMGKEGYKAKYFHAEGCPYCKKSEPYVKVIARFMPVETVTASKATANIFAEWKAERTPTIFFIKGNDASKMVGEINSETLGNFLLLLK